LFRTVRVRTTLLATLATAAVLVAASFALMSLLTKELTESGDSTSQARVRDLLSAAADGRLPTTIDPGDDESVAQVVAADGTVLAASSNVEGRPPLVDWVSTSGELVQATIDGPDDDETERYRIWYADGETPERRVTVLVGRSLESVEEASAAARRLVTFGVPLVLVLLAATVWLAVGRPLRRIDDITSTVAAIDSSDLGRRVPETGVDDEVGRLATTMNRMLGRLEQSSQRQRAFVADASHDLQSPLTGLRAQLEVGLARPADVDVEEWARRLLATSSEMELLVGDLLALAVEEETGEPPQLDLLDLDGLVLEEAARARPATEVTIDTTGVSAAPVMGEAASLRRLVRNLLENAVRHASSEVRLSLSTASDHVVLDVVDDGPGVDDLDRDRVFDRFFRADPARRPGARASGGGSGLGLAIVHQVAERHGGRATLLPAATGGGAHFRVTLPIPG
jgi:signal transduction histidine kinase